jgi:hypothetical protein
MNTLRTLVVTALLAVWSFPAVGLARPLADPVAPTHSTPAAGAAPSTSERQQASRSEAEDMQAREKQAPELQNFSGGAIYVSAAAVVLIILLVILLV